MTTSAPLKLATGAPVFVIAPGSSGRERLTLGKELGTGMEAVVHDIPGWTGCAAKIYRNPAVHRRRAKIEAMLANAPEHLFASVGQRRVPLLAWPTHVLEDEERGFAGFLMTKMLESDSVGLTAYLSGGTPKCPVAEDDRSLPSRLQLCRNLAGVLADLHRQGHFVVDFKPQNLRLFKGSCIPCILDTDGFSIRSRDGHRYPAHAFTPEWASPELLSGSPTSVLDDQSDRFSLAILLFQILNAGIHPYQGILSVDREPNTNEQGIRAGQYAYGLAAHPQIRPMAVAVHDCLPNATRQLFDRAFQSAAPGIRPSAAQWRDHFDALRKAGPFEKCRAEPLNVLHIHFASLACPQCRQVQVFMGFAASVSPGQSSFLPESHVEPDSVSASASTPAPATPAPAPRPRDQHMKKRAAIVAIVALALWIAAMRLGWIETPEFIRHAVATGGSSSAGEAPMPTEPPQAPTSLANKAAPAAPSLGFKALRAVPAVPDTVSQASAMEDASDATGLAARQAVLRQAIDAAVAANGGRFEALIGKAAVAGIDTGSEATDLVLDTTFADRFAGWRTFPAARAINARNIDLYATDLPRALRDQWAALALNPLDREIAGNLAYFIALDHQAEQARAVAIHALSLPRRPGASVRTADWELVAATLAMSGKPVASFGAYAVALTLTSNPAGFCDTLLSQESRFGESLRAPVERAFQLLSTKVPNLPARCALPVDWSMT